MIELARSDPRQQNVYRGQLVDRQHFDFVTRPNTEEILRKIWRLVWHRPRTQELVTPTSMATNVELWMSFDDIYRPALSIPVNICRSFSVHPLTWLRYLGYTIYGNEGHISTSPGGPEVESCQADIQPDNYYYVSQRESYSSDPGVQDLSGGGGDNDRNGGDGGDGEPDDVLVNVYRSKRLCEQRDMRASRQKKAQNLGWLTRNSKDRQAGDNADVVMALWVQNAKKRRHQAHAMKVDSTREKVRTWLESAE